jgi:hypothetical protein
MILNNSQAVAIAKALSELNNICGKFTGTITVTSDTFVSCWAKGDFTVSTRFTSESYHDQTDFFTAYGLN